MYQVWILFGVVIFLVIILYKELLAPSIAFMLAISVLLVAQIITPHVALEGFANEQLAIIVLLLILGNILKKTSVVNTLFKGVFDQKNTRFSFLLKMMGSVGISSAFLNNTPLVAILLPHVYSWSREKGYSPSKFLIPLSFASILGGCITLIGTSTNLIVNALAIQEGEAPLNTFDFSIVGGIMMVIGILYFMLFGQKLLPDNKKELDKFIHNSRDYLLETCLEANSHLINKTVEEAGLRNLKGLFLAAIIRNDRLLKPVSPKDILDKDDVLLFVGNPHSIAEITKPKQGLALPKDSEFPLSEKNDLVEIVVSHNSKLAGKKVKDSDFRGKYNGAILAIHRNGEKLLGKIGEIKLKSGDVLLVLTGKDFMKRIENNPAFYLISTAKEIHNVDSRKVAVLVIGIILSITLSTFNLVPLFISLVLLLLTCIFLNIVQPSEIRNNIDFNLIFIIALGLALGKAMTKSGAANLLASSFVQLSENFGSLGLLASIFAITNLLSAFITSKAAVAITLPIAISISHSLGLPVTPFILIVAYGGAANFITPIGYQTNLMVYGPGRYNFNDFLRVGLPLTIIYLICSVFVLNFLYLV